MRLDAEVFTALLRQLLHPCTSICRRWASGPALPARVVPVPLRRSLPFPRCCVSGDAFLARVVGADRVDGGRRGCLVGTEGWRCQPLCPPPLPTLIWEPGAGCAEGSRC